MFLIHVHVCFPQVYIEDSLGERIWVDSSHCKTFVDNIQTAFNTKMPPKTMLLQAETGRSGGDLSAGMQVCPGNPSSLRVQGRNLSLFPVVAPRWGKECSL